MASGIDWEDVRRKHIVRAKGTEPLASGDSTLTRDGRITQKPDRGKTSEPRDDTRHPGSIANGQAKRNENKSAPSSARPNARKSESIEAAREAIIRIEREKAELKAARLAKRVATERQRRACRRARQIRRPGDAESNQETSAPHPLNETGATAIQHLRKRRRPVAVEYKATAQEAPPNQNARSRAR